MEIISSYLLKYNIGLDAGDNLINVLFNKNTIIPNNKQISFIIPELDEEYNINVVIGDNILGSDNFLLETINLKNLEIKKIFMNIELTFYGIIMTIKNKAHKILYNNLINYNNNITIIYYDKIIDTNFYKLKFDIIQTIKIIRKKIKLGLLIFDIDTNNVLENKLNNIIINIDNLPTQKMLDIKNSLKLKFFID